MRIVVLSETFTKTMGYIERRLPAAMAALGADVHVVAANLQDYFSHPDYHRIYAPFNGPPVVPCAREPFEGFTLHRLPHQLVAGHARARGLSRYLRSLQPDVVQTFAVASWMTMEAAATRPFARFVLLTGAHQTASVMDPRLLTSRPLSSSRIRSKLRRALPGRLVSFAAARCYAATVDCADVAERFYGVPRSKIVVCPLGVETTTFRPSESDAEHAAAAAVRARAGAHAGEVLCVYTGRFTPEKNPLCLARAVSALRARGQPFRALFVGAGPQADVIAREDGCVVHEFVPNADLPRMYRAADIGVWPTQESMSMLDAAACGLPIVVSDRVQARERFEGNGLQYREGDVDDLAAVLSSLSDPERRATLGQAGAQKVAATFSWSAIARQRLSDYDVELGRRRSVARAQSVRA